MFGDDNSAMKDFILQTTKGGDFFNQAGSYYTDLAGMDFASMDFAKLLHGMVDESERKHPKPIRLKNKQQCPVCQHRLSHKIGLALSGTSHFSCVKCGLSEVAEDEHFVVSIEEFSWAFDNQDDAETTEAKRLEQAKVIGYYRKLWNGETLDEQDEKEMEEILSTPSA